MSVKFNATTPGWAMVARLPPRVVRGEGVDGRDQDKYVAMPRHHPHPDIYNLILLPSATLIKAPSYPTTEEHNEQQQQQQQEILLPAAQPHLKTISTNTHNNTAKMKFTTTTALAQALVALLITQAAAAPTPSGELEPRRNVHLGIPQSLALKRPSRRAIMEGGDEAAEEEAPAPVPARKHREITPGTCRRNVCIN